MKHHLVVILISILLVTCGVKQPLDVKIIQETGSLIVTSQPEGAFIFLDGIQQTNYQTPDTLLNISTGTYIVSVYKEGFNSIPNSFVVLVEKDLINSVDFTLEEIDSLASFVIETNPASANILVDGLPTGKQSPDTIRIEEGSHIISVEKNGFQVAEWQVNALVGTLQNLNSDLDIQQCVLLEAFGNVSCIPCVQSAENLETFKESYPRETFALIEYYANWPSTKDPFYLVAPKDVDERVQNVYNIISLPSLRLNGTTSADAAKLSQIENAYQDLYANQTTQLGISINKQKVDTTLQLTIELYDGNNLLSNQDLRLFVAVTEDEITIDPAPGTNGLTHFNFVFRGFISDKEGDVISDSTMQYNFSWPAWNYSNSKIIAFIQDLNTNKVIQASIN